MPPDKGRSPDLLTWDSQPCIQTCIHIYLFIIIITIMMIIIIIIVIIISSSNIITIACIGRDARPFGASEIRRRENMVGVNMLNYNMFTNIIR